MGNCANTILLKSLIQLRGSVCELCGEPVVCIALIKQHNQIKKVTAGHVTYCNDDGEMVTERTATVEHLIRRVDGGGNNSANVVVACFSCNQERNQECEGKRETCRTCGRLFAEGGGRACKKKGCRTPRICKECKQKRKKWFGSDDFGTLLGPLLAEALGSHEVPKRRG